jgi:hypothetical protein
MLEQVLTKDKTSILTKIGIDLLEVPRPHKLGKSDNIGRYNAFN